MKWGGGGGLSVHEVGGGSVFMKWGGGAQSS